MRSWGWGFISLAAIMVMFRVWQMGILLALVGCLMIWRGKKEGEDSDGNSKDDQSTK